MRRAIVLCMGLVFKSVFKISVVAYGEVRLHSDLRLIVGGALPLLPTYCPYRARYHLNPVVGGTQGVVHYVHFTLG